MNLVVYEHDTIATEGTLTDGHTVPRRVFDWLEAQSLNEAIGKPRWLKPTRVHGKHAVKVTNYAGVIRTPWGFQIEVLPKIGRATDEATARELLLRMLTCLGEFRHLQLDEAHLQTRRAPLFEVFIAHFLDTVELLVRQGLRGGYSCIQDELPALRGKLLLSRHLRLNLTRRDRFSVEHDQFAYDRAENRLILTALSRIDSVTSSMSLRRQARQLAMAFDGVPVSSNIARDLQATRIERDMHRYETPLAWSRLILNHLSPLTGTGDHLAPSLLFPMEALFEAYVARHLAKQLPPGYRLKAQARSEYLTTHNGQPWFQLKPDLLLLGPSGPCAVLDTKWKLLDSTQDTARQKYNLSQADFYQLYAYGHHYLGGAGEIMLIYPKTDAFQEPLAEFLFPQNPDMRLLVLPFCLQSQRVIRSGFHVFS